ncbi:GumC family protein [Antarcticirhabdus aurantiaca]|uniref:AAA family ATPase n=1 Tax=Antarcticirhabdus aurantiaca TaxID=2606717 RepID=A0ACD4NIB7_9HYPH|nr:AAA family ATPase [Antarcticirhabdus aurantiaca]WAJ26592.1 AAA family ATPase [Jeongeuplla avenae]
MTSLHLDHPRSTLPADPAPAGMPMDFSLAGFGGMVGRQARPMLLTLVAVLAAAGLVLAFLSPRFDASAIVLVDASPQNLLQPDADAPAPDGDTVDGEVGILRSDGILLEVIEATNLVADPEFGARLGLAGKIGVALRLGGAAPSGPDALSAVLDNLRGALTVRRQGQTGLVSVGLRSISPERAATLANAVVEVYIRQQIGSKVDAMLLAREALERQLERARQTLVEAEAAFSQSVSDNLDALVSSTGQADLLTLHAALRDLVAEQAQTSETVRVLRSEVERKDWTALLAQLDDDAAEELARQRSRIMRALAGATPGSAPETGFRAELAAVEASVSTQAQERIASLEAALSDGETRIAAARQELNAALLHAGLPPDIQARFHEILKASKNAATLYQTLLSRLQQLDAQALLQVADSRIVSRARAPVAPAFPNVPLAVAVSILIASGAALGVGWLLDARRGGFTSAEELHAITGRRVGGLVPKIRGAPDQLTVADEIVDEPLSPAAESLRRLRAAADRALAGRSPGPLRLPRCGAVVMVTSALPGDGKTTLALALARTWAADGRRVLVIDCDLRRPSIHRQLGLDPAAALADLLDGSLPADGRRGFAMQDPLSTVRVIPGRDMASVNADALLRSAAFGELLEAMQAIFDIVVLDTPPVEPVIDALHVAGKADLFAFVVKAGRTPRRAVSNALASLTEAADGRGETLLVLNGRSGRTTRLYGTSAG